MSLAEITCMQWNPPQQMLCVLLKLSQWQAPASCSHSEPAHTGLLFASLQLQCFWSTSAELPTTALLDVRRWTGIPLLEATSNICLSWAPRIKATPGFRDSGRITSGELISNQREFQFQVARRRHNQHESLINTDTTGCYGFLYSWAPGLWVLLCPGVPGRESNIYRETENSKKRMGDRR